MISTARFIFKDMTFLLTLRTKSEGGQFDVSTSL